MEINYCKESFEIVDQIITVGIFVGDENPGDLFIGNSRLYKQISKKILQESDILTRIFPIDKRYFSELEPSCEDSYEEFSFEGLILKLKNNISNPENNWNKYYESLLLEEYNINYQEKDYQCLVHIYKNKWEENR